MTTRQKIRIPSLGSTADIAGRHLYKNGPASEAELCLAVDFGIEPSQLDVSLQRAVSTGWLSILPSGKLWCSPAAKVHYDDAAGLAVVMPKYIGLAAAPRDPGNVYARKPLSRQHIPNTRGLRQDIPSWSVRPEGFCLKSIGGSEA